MWTSVVLPVTAGRTASELFAATVHMKNPTVSDADIERVLSAGSHHSVREGRAVLHSLPIGYALDDSRGIRDPRGMIGQRLGVDMHVVTTDVAAARNLTLLVERCHIGVEAMVAAPYVSGLSVLAEDEADLGAAIVDLGAGTTTMSVFAEGRFVHVDGFALGGHHVTMDIARGLTTTIADAERLKTLFGAALSGPSDDRDMVSLAAADADPHDPPRMIPRAQLVRIIRPRVEEILEMVRDRLHASPFAADPRGRVILTGGASQLTGLSDLATQILGRQVRIGRPSGIGGLSDATKGPAFAAAAGLLVYPQFAYLEHCEPRKTRQLMTGTDGYFTRVGRWLRESFRFSQAPQIPSANRANRILCTAMIRAGRRRAWAARGKRVGADGTRSAGHGQLRGASRAAARRALAPPRLTLGTLTRFAGQGKRSASALPASVKTRNTRAFPPRHPANFTHLFTILSADCAPRSRARARAASRGYAAFATRDRGTSASDDRHHFRHGRKPANPCGDTRASALTRGQA